MQKGEEHRALQREIMMRCAGEVLDDCQTAVSSHNRSNAGASPMRRAELVATISVVKASTRMALGAKRLPERGRRSSCRSRANPRRAPAVRLAHGLAFATAFDDQEIGAAPESFLRKCIAPVRRATQPGGTRSCKCPSGDNLVDLNRL